MRRDRQAGEVRVRRIFISGGHNYFGRHGRGPAEWACQERSVVVCQAGRGIEGDRFFDYRPGYKGQITFFAWETVSEVCAAFAAFSGGPEAFRRNVIIEGLDLNELIGSVFRLGGLLLEGVEECRPCYWMDQAVGPGAEAFLRGRGGLRARILEGGEVRVGPVEFSVAAPGVSPSACGSVPPT